MAKERVYSEVLNLRVDEPMSREIARIAKQLDQPESETARSLIEWGINAHRAKEAALLRLPYNVNTLTNRHGEPLELEIVAQWVEVQWDEEP